MAIVKMKRLSLLAMKADKDKIYDALIKSNVVQLKRSEDAHSAEVSAALETQLAKVARVEDAISYLAETTAQYNAQNKREKDFEKAEIPKNSFARPKTEIDFDFFLSFGKNAQRIEADLDELQRLKNKVAQLQNECTQNRAEFLRLILYADLPHPTTWYADTESAVVRLCQMPSSEVANVKELLQQFDLVEVSEVCSRSSTSVVAVVAHRSQTEFFEKAAAYGLVDCPLKCDVLPRLLLNDLSSQYEKLNDEINQVTKQIVAFDQNVTEWKIYSDYLDLCAKKVQADGDITITAETFALEGYYPAEDEQKVAEALSVSDCVVYSFAEIGEEEFAPTLVKNNKVVKQFEFVTNMYTPPDYHEVDPNPVMAIFYFVIFGFMVADMGYGLLLVLAGLFAAFAIKQPSGIKTMLQLFGICGVSAVAVGALFGSFFSYPLYAGVIPDPSKYPMVMMILSLILGIVHIMAGIACNMAVKIKHKQTAAAWLCDFPWLIVFVGLVIAIWNAALDMAAYEPYFSLKLPQTVTNVGLYVCLGALAVALVFAGLGQKGILGKLMKSFS
ncbi:MAG: V-type ATP synthase subunit I, partial [Candidatus Fimimonas sp.]